MCYSIKKHSYLYKVLIFFRKNQYFLHKGLNAFGIDKTSFLLGYEIQYTL